MSDQKRSQWRLFLTVATFIVLVILIYSLRQQIGGVIQNLGKVNAVALLLIIPIEIINYDAYARMFRSLLETMGKQVSYKSMYKLTLELNFVNHILPSASISGISYFTLRSRSEGITAAQATLSQVTKMFMLYISYQPLLILGLFFLAMKGHINDLILATASSLITLVVVGTVVVVYVIGSQKRINTFLTAITRILNWLIHLVRRNHPETFSIDRAQRAFIELHDNYQIFKRNPGAFKKPLLYALIANITEVASVYVVYIAFGELVNVGAVILAYAVANFAGLLSVLPAGIGVYEGLMTAILAATGIPVKLSIPVTVMYRVINMIVQLVPGYIFYQRAVKTGLTKKV